MAFQSIVLEKVNEMSIKLPKIQVNQPFPTIPLAFVTIVPFVLNEVDFTVVDD
jgi:hypothetical protein